MSSHTLKRPSAICWVRAGSREHDASLSPPNEVKTLLETATQRRAWRALLSADDPAALARDVIKKGLNVRQTEKLVKVEILKTN